MINIKSKLLMGFVGLLVALLALPLGTASVYADQANGYYILSTTSVSPSSVLLKGSGVNDTATVSVSARGIDTSNPNGADVVLVIDVSGSMSGQPIADEIIAAKSFISSMNSTNNQVAVVPFASDTPQPPESIQQLTNNFSLASSYIDGIDNMDTTGGGTDYVPALTVASAELASSRVQSGSNKVIVFLSDGQGGGTGLDTLVANIKSSGVEIYTIGLDSSSDQSGLDVAASDQLKSIASSTQGTDDHFFLSASSDNLTGIYATISQSIATAVATEVKMTLKLSSQVELVAGSWSTTPTSSSGNTYVFDLPDATSNKTNNITFKVKVPSGQSGQAVPIFETSGSIINYKDALDVVSSVAVNNQTISVIMPITAPNTAFGKFVLSNPLLVAVLGIISAVSVIFATRRQLSKK